MLARIRTDVRTALENDPAADHWATVVLTYAGLHAVWGHVLAHGLWKRGHRVIARVLSHGLRFLTGVEIHPAADLGERVFIDHGMGTVVGETAEIGDDVQMFHGVTLGGKSDDPVKRHPTVEDGVTIGANATLIGDITVGRDATVGAGAVVVDDVEAGDTVAGVPARPLESDGGETPADVVTGGAVDRTDVDRISGDRVAGDQVAGGDGAVGEEAVGDGATSDGGAGDGPTSDGATGDGNCEA